MDLTDLMFTLYPYAKALHIMAVLSWMAGLFYLPRLFVYHVEQAEKVPDALPIFVTMQDKLHRLIMRPAMMVTWGAGLFMVATPGIVSWDFIWPWTKGISVIAMTLFHIWLWSCHQRLKTGENQLSGRQFRLMNEIPTLLMVVIVVSVVFKF